MDTRQEAAIEFTDNRKVDESTVTSKESDNQVKLATSSKPKKQKVAKRPKRVSAKTSGQENSSADTVVATTFRLRSKREGMCGAEPASRSATPQAYR
jgi:hypothetical protein